MNPNDPAAGVQLYMEGSPSSPHCNELGVQSSWTFFPCAKEQGPLSVKLGTDCTANFTMSGTHSTSTQACTDAQRETMELEGCAVLTRFVALRLCVARAVRPR